MKTQQNLLKPGQKNRETKNKDQHLMLTFLSSISNPLVSPEPPNMKSMMTGTNSAVILLTSWATKTNIKVVIARLKAGWP